MPAFRPLNNTFIFILAIFFSSKSILSLIYYEINIVTLSSTFMWLGLAVFAWKNRRWAIILLGWFAAFIFINDIILSVPQMKDYMNEFSQISVILIVFLEIIVLGCFIYNGIFYLFADKKQEIA